VSEVVPPVLVARSLAVVAGDRRLVAPSSFALKEGERVLLVGPSGGGKSLFLDLLLGFAGPSSPGLLVTGELALDGQPLLGRPPGARDQRVGAVFQLHASGLFDDLTVAENLRFGDRDPERASAVAAGLGLGALSRRAVQCSGGERLRVVLARTLLRGAGVLAYDEPTSGLDPAAAAQVVQAIRASHRRLTLVVTHDYDAFAGFADRILFLDPTTRSLRLLSADEEAVREVRARLASAPPASSEPRTAPPRSARLRAGWGRLADRTADTLADFGVALLGPAAWFRPAAPLDGPRVRQALARHLAPGVSAFVATSALLVALTATYFLFDRLPERAFAEPLFLDDLLAGLGLILVRVAVPLVASILLAAKLGASTAAHLGHMSLTRQVDALHLLRVPLRRHLLLPAAGGQLAAAWVHGALALGVAFVTSMGVFLGAHPGWSALYFQRAWTQEIEAPDLLWVAGKMGASALAVAAVAFRAGTSPKREPEDVVSAIHATLLGGLLLVLAVHAAFAFLEFA
jgi:energy-coupling factor transporter ATP-binding protein EcfA2